ncbi:MAG: carboxypeptidase regulatory-like domain-containing protein, partial [Actinomycetota bacterium]
ALSVEGTDRQATTAADGSYALVGLAASETPKRVAASHADYITEEADATVAPNATTALDFALERTSGQIFGKVTDARPAAAPIAGAGVVLVATDLQTTTDGNGDYDFPRVAPGSYTVKATADGYFDRDNEANVTVTKDTGSEANLSLQPQPGTLTVTVNGAAGPLDADVSLGGAAPVATGGDGTYTFSEVPAGDDYSLVVSHADHQTQTDSVDVGPGEDVTRTYTLTLKPGTVVLTVHDEAGNGLAGAAVTFDGSTQTTTSDTATVTFEDVAPGAGYVVAVSHPDYEPAGDSIDVAPGATVERTYALAATPGTVTVNVTGFGDTPLNANVGLDGGTPEAIGEDGSVTFSSVAAGTHTVTAAHPDYESEDAQSFTLAPNGSETLELSLDPKTGSITVKVTGFGGTSLDAQVSLDGEDPAATGADGTHTFSGVQAGSHTVSVAHADYESVDPRAVSLGPNGSATESFALVARPGSIHGFVRDAGTGAVIDGASVTLDDGPPIIAAGGEFTFSDVPPGDHIVRASASPTHIANNVAVAVAPNGAHETTVNLNPAPGSVAGVVRDQASDEPIAGATVALVETTLSTTTDADGRYSIADVSRGSYTVRASAEDYVTEDVPITVAPGTQTTQNVNLSHQVGRVAGTVRNATDTQPVEDATIELDGVTTTTAADGAYAFEGVRVGTYNLRANAEGFASTERSVTVTADETQTIDVNLSPTLSGSELRIVLTWNAAPPDLDSHLWLPSTKRYHVYYAQKGSNSACPFARLDVDDTNGRGPETITISQGFTGSYRYAVHDYRRPLGVGGNIAGSRALVQVFDSSGLRASFEAPAGGSGQWWHVANLDYAPGNQTWVLHSVDRLSGSSPAPYDDALNGSGCSS